MQKRRRYASSYGERTLAWALQDEIWIYKKIKIKRKRKKEIWIRIRIWIFNFLNGIARKSKRFVRRSQICMYSMVYLLWMELYKGQHVYKVFSSCNEINLIYANYCIIYFCHIRNDFGAGTMLCFLILSPWPFAVWTIQCNFFLLLENENKIWNSVIFLMHQLLICCSCHHIIP